jgi:hypothetical protein
MKACGTECEVCGRVVEVERIGATAPVLCAAHAGAASAHTERVNEVRPEDWET